MANRRKHSWSPAIGCWVTMPSHWSCEVAAAAGFDAVFLDLEHGTIDVESQDRLLAQARALGLQAYVRVAMAQRAPIQQALDSGAHAVVLPQVRDLAHAKEAAAYAKYPPLGLRGMGTPRSLGYGDTPGDFVLRENERTRCYVMVETPGALRDARKIAALPTVDGLFMGPYDLSLTRGRGQFQAGRADDADARAIAAAARAAGKLVGMPAGDERGRRLAREFGAAVITLGEDLGIFAEAMTQTLRRTREALG